MSVEAMAQISLGVVGDWRLSDEEFLATFRLPTAADKHEVLQAANPMIRESRIKFDEVTHTYTVDGVKVPISVTGLIHQFSHDFDPFAAIESMKVKDWETKQLKFIKDDGEVMTDEEIAASWSRNGEVQRSRGQLLHFHCEQFLNGCSIEQPWSPEFEQFVALHNEIISTHFQAFRTEVSVFHCGLKLAGQIDCLCKDSDGRLVILDWKRSRRIVMESRRQMQPPLHHLPDCNYFHYALQLNIYRWILESEYGYRVSSMFLGIFHPLSECYKCIEVPRLDAEMSLIVQYYGGQAPIPGESAPFIV